MITRRSLPFSSIDFRFLRVLSDVPPFHGRQEFQARRWPEGGRKSASHVTPDTPPALPPASVLESLQRDLTLLANRLDALHRRFAASQHLLAGDAHHHLTGKKN